MDEYYSLPASLLDGNETVCMQESEKDKKCSTSGLTQRKWYFLVCFIAWKMMSA
jgi:hypothetical protein